MPAPTSTTWFHFLNWNDSWYWNLEKYNWPKSPGILETQKVKLTKKMRMFPCSKHCEVHQDMFCKHIVRQDFSDWVCVSAAAKMAGLGICKKEKTVS